MIKFWNWFRKKDKLLADRALERFRNREPIPDHIKGMFADETAEAYAERFKKAREVVKDD